MQPGLASSLAAVLWVTWTSLATAGEPRARPLVLRPGRPPGTLSVPTIDFRDFFSVGQRAPQPTAKLLSLHQQRVTLVGYMVRLERPVHGGFYLTGHPVACDESGGGRGDLPAAAVLILPAIAPDREVAFVAGALEVSGVLDVGNVDYQGEGVSVRLLVDDLKQVRFARTHHTTRAAARPESRGRSGR
jgi:hypothetical protein